MSLEDLGNIGEFVAAVAVVVSLIYLAVQIRQNTRWLRASLEQSITDSTSHTIQAAASSPQFARIVAEGQERFDDLAEEEQRQFALWVLGFFRIYEQAFHQFSKGNLSNEIWSGYEAQLRMSLRSDAIRGWWGARREFFHERFREYVEQVDFGDAPPSPNTVLAAMKGGEGTSQHATRQAGRRATVE
jgi:hypothetical protein